ncbi:hypothetical protein KY328_05215 [Candidatus Woesearchaeota archaeon]|nr:hypothetical protein [Candidatus Woesearchaeota archaeon]MBW3022297.1 hypothetical protein [Candidatus Woesearchaeota archaeon]
MNEALEDVILSAGSGLGVSISLVILNKFSTLNFHASHTLPLAFGFSTAKSYNENASIKQCIANNISACAAAFLSYSLLNYIF